MAILWVLLGSSLTIGQRPTWFLALWAFLNDNSQHGSWQLQLGRRSASKKVASLRDDFAKRKSGAMNTLASFSPPSDLLLPLAKLTQKAEGLGAVECSPHRSDSPGRSREGRDGGVTNCMPCQETSPLAGSSRRFKCSPNLNPLVGGRWTLKLKF